MHVTPYIAVEVTLSSADGRLYSLAVAGHRLAAGPSPRVARVTLPGLRPGGSYVAAVAGGGTVVISAAGEPGA